MAWVLESDWQPTKLLEFGTELDTSTSPARVMTDAGPTYLKAMGNRQGPHVLATDWVGTWKMPLIPRSIGALVDTKSAQRTCGPSFNES